MDNIQISNIRPNNSNNAVSDDHPTGAFVSYIAVLNGKDHRINGSFLASDEEVNSASTNHKNWDGFKKLVLDRINNDLKDLNKA